MAKASDIARYLTATPMPADVVDSLLTDASPWWLVDEQADVLAGDLALCHPPLHPGEVRAVVRSSTDPSTCRLTVVAERNPGLLAAVAATVAAEGLLVTKAAVSTWHAGDITVIGTRLVRPGEPIGGANWERIGARIKTAILDGALPDVDFEPRPPVTVDVIRPEGEEHPEGLVVVVRAPHRVGLLWATCSWFAAHGCLVEVAHIEPAGDIRQSIYVVRGEVDARALRAHLLPDGGRARVIGWPGRWLGGLLGRLVGSGTREPVAGPG